MSDKPKISGLYAITPDLNNTDVLLDKTQQVLAGGAQLIQYRNKSAHDALRRQQAGLLLKLCREYKVPLIINDHIELAAALDADGVHVGRDDGSIGDARKQLGQDKIVGASCYNDLGRALQAQALGSDYVAFGAFFPSLTKTDTVSASKKLVGQAKQKMTVPVVGIGGIRLANAVTVIQSGCDAIAICNDLFTAENIQVRARQYARLFTAHHQFN
ncbi:MAG: thiamine phosphate synthase [Betaproteobacteria bacterium]|nr:thiamine phosphate synthase [Betaproteobacteria bacterium]